MVGSLYQLVEEEYEGQFIEVLNLVLDGRLLIQKMEVINMKHKEVFGFKPCFRWSAPYTWSFYTVSFTVSI